MSRRPLDVVALEAREVPAAGAFADIMPGIWGSYPHDFASSGTRLYFAADNGHGDEVYASDGTATGTKLIKDLSPTARGSAPRDILGAGNGIAYFTADDGSGRALYRTDGTATGTVKVPGPSVNMSSAFGSGGALYFTAMTDAGTGVFRTDGGNPLLLATMTGPARPLSYANGLPGRVYFQSATPEVAGESDYTIVSTDGTPAGTFSVAGKVRLGNEWNSTPVAELAPGKWIVHQSVQTHDNINRLVISDANGEREIAWFEPERDSYTGWSVDNLQLAFGRTAETPLVNGKLLFSVHRNSTSSLWTTDGTPEGTHAVDAGTAVADRPFYLLASFGNRLLMSTSPDNGLPQMVLTDGTPTGTNAILDPDGVPYQAPTYGSDVGSYLGQLSASAGVPNGLLVFHTATKIFVTDGTPGGARWVDTTGLPADQARYRLSNAINSTGIAQPAIVNGSLYFAGPRVGDIRPEPWKWELAPAKTVTPPMVPPRVAPKVASVVINGGAAQRSMVTTIDVTFDSAVTLAAGVFELKPDTAGTAAPQLTIATKLVAGKTVATLTFAGPGVVGGSLADGTFHFTVHGDKVKLGTTAMATDSTTTLHRLFGDLDGDRNYDRASRWMLHERLGATRGQTRYMAEFDFDGDGVIGASDELAVVRHWGRSV